MIKHMQMWTLNKIISFQAFQIPNSNVPAWELIQRTKTFVVGYFYWFPYCSC